MVRGLGGEQKVNLGTSLGKKIFMDLLGGVEGWQYLAPLVLILGGTLAWWKWQNSSSVSSKDLIATTVSEKKVVRPKKKEEDTEGKTVIKFFYGSQTGTAEDFAHQLAKESRAYNFAPQVIDLEEFDHEELEKEKYVIFLMATYGEGEPTDNARQFYEYLNSEERTASLQNVRYAVFGLGNKTYELYNAIGRRLDQRLGELGAQRLYSMGEGDDDSSLEEDFAAWRASLWPAVAEQLGVSVSVSTPSDSGADDRFRVEILQSEQEEGDHLLLRSSGKTWDLKHPGPGTVIENRELCTNPDERSVRHVELKVPPGLTYLPGDHIGVYPENPPDVVASLLKRLGLSPSQALNLKTPKGIQLWKGTASASQALRQWWDLLGVPRKQIVSLLSRHATNPSERDRLAELADPQKAEPYSSHIRVAHRTLGELLAEFPSVEIPAEVLLAALPRLQPRYYSVASSMDLYPQQAHLTVALVRFTTATGREHLGMCSSWLAGLSEGSSVPMFVQAAPSFRLPVQPHRPVLCIGPGTGVAPFRGFLQTKRSMRLFFGCRSESQDFLYRFELEDAVKQNQLDLVTAFSRDQANKIYVQHRLRERTAEVWELLHSQEAHVYICGYSYLLLTSRDARVMAKDVQATLLEIIQTEGGKTEEEAKKYFDTLQSAGRYSTGLTIFLFTKDVWF